MLLRAACVQGSQIQQTLSDARSARGSGPQQAGAEGGRPGLTEEPGPPAVQNRVLSSGGRYRSGLETGSENEGTVAGTALRASREHSWGRRTRLQAQLSASLAVWPWGSHHASLSLSLLLCKLWLLTPPHTLLLRGPNEVTQVCCSLWQVPTDTGECSPN